MLPLGSIGAWLSGLLEAAKSWLTSLGIFLPTIPTVEGNPEAGDVTEAASSAHAVFSITRAGHRTGYPARHLPAVPHCAAVDLRRLHG